MHEGEIDAEWRDDDGAEGSLIGFPVRRQSEMGTATHYVRTQGGHKKADKVREVT